MISLLSFNLGPYLIRKASIHDFLTTFQAKIKIYIIRICSWQPAKQLSWFNLAFNEFNFDLQSNVRNIKDGSQDMQFEPP